MKDKERSKIANEEKGMEKWREYFREMFNENTQEPYTIPRQDLIDGKI